MKAILATIIAASLTVGCAILEGEQTTTDTGGSSSGGSGSTYDPAADPNTPPKYVAVGSCCYDYSIMGPQKVGGRIVTSVDGKTWIERTNPAYSTNPSMSEIIYAEDKFVAIGDNGTIVTSAEGLTWEAVQLGTLGYLRDIAYGDNKFVAVEGNHIHWSDNGTVWSTVSPSLPNKRYFSTVMYGGGYFVITTGASGDYDGNEYVYTSNDGMNWTQSATMYTGTTHGSTSDSHYLNGNYYVSGNLASKPYIFLSTDRVNWTKVLSNGDTNGNINLGSGLDNLGNSVMVGVGWSRTHFSSNGSYFQKKSLPNYGHSLYAVTYGDNEFIAVGGDGSGGAVIMKSNDGIDWSEISTNINGGISAVASNH